MARSNTLSYTAPRILLDPDREARTERLPQAPAAFAHPPAPPVASFAPAPRPRRGGSLRLTAGIAVAAVALGIAGGAVWMRAVAEPVTPAAVATTPVTDPVTGEVLTVPSTPSSAASTTDGPTTVPDGPPSDRVPDEPRGEGFPPEGYPGDGFPGEGPGPYGPPEGEYGPPEGPYGPGPGDYGPQGPGPYGPGGYGPGGYGGGR